MSELRVVVFTKEELDAAAAALLFGTTLDWRYPAFSTALGKVVAARKAVAE